MKLNKLLLVSARYQRENLYREINLKHLFEQKGIEVTYLLPTRNVTTIGYTEDVKSDTVFGREGAVFLESNTQFLKYIKRCDAVLFGSWKSYSMLTEAAKAYRKPVINFNSTSGLDHWGHGVDLACFKSEFHKRYTLCVSEIFSDNRNKLKEDQVVITGSIIHDKPYGMNIISAGQFHAKYRLSADKPIAVLFPKAIGGMKDKVPKWFLDWSPDKCNEYNQSFLDKYVQICKAVKNAGYNLIVKMHPTAYTSYLTKYDDEYTFWNSISNAKVLESEDTYSCYKHMDVGIGINTHSALDTGYYRKPFIYVDSDKFEMPQTPIFQIEKHCRIPLGPSSHWDKGSLGNVNPWFPSWLGYFCRENNLADVLVKMKERPDTISDENWHRFVHEFWHEADGKAGKRIVDAVIRYVQNVNNSKKCCCFRKALIAMKLGFFTFKAGLRC